MSPHVTLCHYVTACYCMLPYVTTSLKVIVCHCHYVTLCHYMSHCYCMSLYVTACHSMPPCYCRSLCVTLSLCYSMSFYVTMLLYVTVCYCHSKILYVTICYCMSLYVSMLQYVTVCSTLQFISPNPKWLSSMAVPAVNITITLASPVFEFCGCHNLSTEFVTWWMQRSLVYSLITFSYVAMWHNSELI